MTRAARVSPAALFVAVFSLYMLTGRVVDYGDNLANRYLPLTIARDLTFDLSGVPSLYDGKVFFSLRPSNGHLVSTYPIGTAVAAVPVYLVPVLLGLSPESAWLPALEKVAAAAMAALSVILLYLALGRLATRQIALAIALIYGLGTTTFSMTSQGLFQHTGSQLFLCAGLYLLVRGRDNGAYAASAGLPLAAAVICRPANLVIAAPLAAYVLRRHRGRVPGFLGFALLPTAFQVAYNYVYFDSVFVTGYGTAVLNPWSASWSSPFLDGFLGLAISPRVGLFVYSPIFLFSCAGMIMSCRRGTDPLLRYVAACPVLVLLLCSRWAMWWGAWNYGPRLLADVSPFLAFLLLPVFELAGKVAVLKTALYGLAVLSIVIHAVGAFSNDGSWTVLTTTGDPSWSWRGSPIVHYSEKLLASVNATRASLARRVQQLPDSRGAPTPLAAAYEVVTPPGRAATSEPIRFSLRAVNTGAAVWLRAAPGGRGAVRLGWRWLKDGTELPGASGRLVLAHDVVPGAAHTFSPTLWPPPLAGLYLLELAMLDEHRGWFQDVASPPVRLGVSVAGEAMCDPAAVISTAPAPVGGPFELAFSTDRAMYRQGDLVNTRLALRNSGPARLVRIHVLSEGPEGDFAFLDGGRFTPYQGCAPWMNAGIADFVPSGFTAPEPLPTSAFGWSLRDVPPGDYRLHVVVTESSALAPVVAARAHAAFVVVPRDAQARSDGCVPGWHHASVLRQESRCGAEAGPAATGPDGMEVSRSGSGAR